MYIDYKYLPNYTEPLYRPPSEANSLILQITDGCSYNGCSFCGMYVNKKFKLKPFDKIKTEIDNIPENIRNQVLKIFLADGDAAIYPFDELSQILDYINLKFGRLRRISSYAGPHAILSKNEKEWTILYDKGLKLLYFGLESGNNTVLELMNKSMKADHILPYCKSLRNIGIKLSVMVILGGGGVKYSFEHAIDSAKWITEVNPEFFSLLTLFIRRKKNYFEKIQTPSIGNLMVEAKNIIENINGKNIIFRSNHISNFISLQGTLSKDKDSIVQKIDYAIDILKNKNQFDLIPDFYQENML